VVDAFAEDSDGRKYTTSLTDNYTSTLGAAVSFGDMVLYGGGNAMYTASANVYEIKFNNGLVVS